MSSLIRRRALAAAFGMAAGVLLACEPRVSVGSNKDSTPLPFAFIPKAYNNRVFHEAYTGASNATADIASGTGRRVAVENLAPDAPSADAQKLKVQLCIEKREPIIVSCVEDAVTESIAAAVRNGIPVITFDSDCPESGRLDFYGTDNTKAGIEAADLLAAAVDGAGGKRIAILSGRENASNLNERVNAFTARLKEAYPTFELVPTFYCEERADHCRKKLEDELLTQFPDLDGLFVTGLWGVEAACNCASTNSCNCDAEKLMPKWHAAKVRGLKTVVFDALPFELQLMREGYLTALIGQQYYEWGYCTVTSMFEYLAKGKPVDLSNSPYEVVTPENVETAWAKWVAVEQVDAGSGRATTPACQ